MWKRHLVIIVIVFGFLFFINVDRIQAKNCNCYYVGQHDQVVLGHDTVYAVKIKYTDDEPNDTCVDKQHCTSRAQGITPGYVVDICEAWRENGDTSSACISQKGAVAGYPFVSAEIQDEIVKQHCTVEACSQAHILFWSQNESKEIVSEKNTAENGEDYSHTIFSATSPLKAIDRKDYEQLKHASSLVEEAIDQGHINSSHCDEECIASIMAWGNLGYDVLDSDGKADCSILWQEYENGKNFRNLLSIFFWIICIIAIILLIIFTCVEFIKVITGQDDDGMRVAFKHTLIRILCVVMLLLLPMLISWIVGTINEKAASEFTIGADGEVLCNIAEE